MDISSSQIRQPAATPTYILRGHVAPIHALQIFNKNLRLVSGDADGWIVVWDLVFKRPIAVWKAHEGAILEVKGFSLGTDTLTEIYTHGRDHKLRVWRFSVQDEALLCKTLPVDVNGAPQQSAQIQPWLVHSLLVNALNFCAFSMIFLNAGASTCNTEESRSDSTASIPPSSVLIAVPNALDSGAIDLFHLPSEKRICTIPADQVLKTGMVMAAHLSKSAHGELYVVAAYEDGHVMVFGRRGRLGERDFSGDTGRGPWKWEKLYLCRPHSQPALSIDVFPTGDYFLSSSADAVLAKHPIPRFEDSPLVGRHVQESPLKSVNTKHAGQQGLRIRSDGKIFATAGWDSRIRVYSCKTMKELAVLKWHKDGCYAVAFADVSLAADTGDLSSGDTKSSQQREGNREGETQLIRHEEKDYSLAQVQRQRNLRVQTTHWLAAGSKDGKISLWDIY